MAIKPPMDNELRRLYSDISPMPKDFLADPKIADIYWGLAAKSYPYKLQRIQSIEQRKDLTHALSSEMSPFSIGIFGERIGYLLDPTIDNEATDYLRDYIKELTTSQTPIVRVVDENSSIKKYSALPREKKSGFTDYIASSLAGFDHMHAPFERTGRAARSARIGYNEFLFYTLTQGPLAVRELLKASPKSKEGDLKLTLDIINEKIIPPVLSYVQGDFVFPDIEIVHR